MLISPENTFTEASRMTLDPICGHHGPASLTQIINHHALSLMGLPWRLRGKESACQRRSRGFDPWFRKIPWRRKWQPTAVFLPGKSHGQRNLAGYSSWGLKRVGHDWSNLNNSSSLLLAGILVKSSGPQGCFSPPCIPDQVIETLGPCFPRGSWRKGTNQQT